MRMLALSVATRSSLSTTFQRVRCSVKIPTHQFSSQSENLNNGKISGVFLFHRHGDRTPNRPLCADHKIDEEANFWRTKLPPDDLVTTVSSRFPTKIHPSETHEFLDSRREPFGYLTFRGALQMQNTGKRLRIRYNRENKAEFIDHWDLQVYSTKYLRTTLSAQFFLDGLLSLSSSDPVVPVQVRHKDNDNLNAFDKRPEDMARFVGDVIASQTFQYTDKAAAPLAARLANFLPGLAKTCKSSFGGPSGINWIHAADHFICRDSHNVPLSCLEYPDLRNEEAMRSMASQTIAHLAWRFRKWYQSPQLLNAIACPPLKEIEYEMRSLDTLPNNSQRPFKVYSCHDVTILALLYALNADIVKEGSRFWPPYASTLVFEFVKMKEENDAIVRIFLNGKSVTKDLLSIDDFSKLIEGLDIAAIKASDEEANIIPG